MPCLTHSVLGRVGNFGKNGNISTPFATNLRQHETTPRKEGRHILPFLIKGNVICTRDTPKECLQWAALKLLELKSQSRIDAGEEKPKFYFVI